ncbi:MAG: flagellar basal body L-ring protein FlgH [Pirellulaceae bacterium]
MLSHRKLLVIAAVATCTASFIHPPAGFAQSLWDNRQPSKAFLFQDTQARHVGDLITVLVSENTDVANSEQRSLSKSTDANNTFEFNYGGNGGSGGISQDFNADSQRNFDGSASFSSARDFTDRITVTVLDVLPNGNLLVGGKRKVMIEGDARMLVVSGIVRPWDVRADNTIQSRYVANFEIAYQGAGVEPAFTKQSWLGRITNTLWPF